MTIQPLTLPEILSLKPVKGSVKCGIYQEIPFFGGKVLKCRGTGFFINKDEWSQSKYELFMKDMEKGNKIYIYSEYLGDRIEKATGRVFSGFPGILH